MALKLSNFSAMITMGTPPPRTQEFFDAEALERRYYYNMDTRGFLYLESADDGGIIKARPPVRNMATALKDTKFLQFFFKMLRPNEDFHKAAGEQDEQQRNILLDSAGEIGGGGEGDGGGLQHHMHFPFYSVCGKEKSFLRLDDEVSAFGFQDLVRKDDGDVDSGYILRYGGNLSEDFDPSSLMYSNNTGRLYHPINSHKYLKGQYGLLHPITAQNLIEEGGNEDEKTIGFRNKIYRYSDI